MAARAQLPGYGALLGACLALGMLAGVHPAVAVGAAAAAGFALVLTADLTAGLAVFILVSFAERTPALAGSDITAVKALGLLLALGWLAAVATGRAGGRLLPARHPALSAAVVLFVAWMVLSTGWSEDQVAAGGDIQRYVLNLLLLPIVFTAVRSERDVVVIASTFVGGAVLSALIAMATADEGDGLGRISGITGTANELASLVVTALLLAGGLAVAAARTPLSRLLLAVSMGICLLALYLTLSRGGLVALAAALLAAVFLAGRWRAGTVVVVVVVGLTAMGYFSLAAPDQARERVTTIGDGTGRTDIWTVAWRMVEDRPLTGVGVGNFQTSSVHYLLEPGTIRRDEFIVDRPQVAHNSYLHVLAELGLPGLLLFLGIVGACLRCAWQAAHTFLRLGDPVLEALSRALVLALVALLVADLFASDQLNKELWLLLGLGPALLAIARERAGADHLDSAW